MSFSWKDRQSALRSLAEKAPELIILGGGAVGCSIAAHAAQLGLNCVLFEQNDLASGASGNSTGLAHAGLRYLAQGRFWYVFREGRERRRLQQLAPHWVHPFNFILPVYESDHFGLGMVKIGTWIYDLLGWIDAALTRNSLRRRHRALSRETLQARVPGIRSEGLQGGVEYFVDAQLMDSRFTLGFAQLAARYGARVMTYVEVVSVNGSSVGQPVVTARDRLSGRGFDLAAPLVINATGAWIDPLRSTAGLPKPIVRMSKGIHLVVDHVVDTPLIMSSEVKGGVFFVLPFGKDQTVIGTTDNAYEGNPSDAAPDPKEIQELIRRLFHFFPYLKQGSNLAEAIELYKQVHIRDIYWGLRPLLRQEGATIDASREHAIVEDLPGFWSVPGVKLTAARAVGEEAATKAWKAIRQSAPPKFSANTLPGGDIWDYDRYVTDARGRFRMGDDSPELLSHLVSFYGTRYVEVLQWANREPHYSEPVVPGEPWLLAEAAYAAHEEMVLTLNDFLWRRTKWAHLRDLPDDRLQVVAAVLAKHLEWSPEEVRSQIETYELERKKHRL